MILKTTNGKCYKKFLCIFQKKKEKCLPHKKKMINFFSFSLKFVKLSFIVLDDSFHFSSHVSVSSSIRDIIKQNKHLFQFSRYTEEKL